MSTAVPARWTRPAIVTATIALACARPAPPPGGPEDTMPPQVVTITPEPMSVVAGWNEDVVIRFGERLSERGMENVLMVSPPTGRAKLDRAGWGSELRISLDGGWRAGRIYRVVLRPGLRDRFGNARDEPIEMVFSTGPPIPASAVTGVVTDRMTGRPVEGARVEARTAADTIPLVALADSVGRFVLPHTPPDRYRILAYRDDNRSAAREPFEARDTADARLEADTDTASVSLALLVPDSSPAVLTRAEAIDSIHVRLVFDDAFDPDAPLEGASATVRRLPDSTTVSTDGLLHAHVFEARRAERTAPDSAAEADTLASEPADTAVSDAEAGARAAPGDVAPGAPGAAADSAAADSAAADTARAAPLPKRELVLVAARALEAGASFTVEVAGLTNIAGVRGGGGVAEFDTPDPASADTTAAPADTTTMPADTTTVPADTTASGGAPAGDAASVP